MNHLRIESTRWKPAHINSSKQWFCRCHILATLLCASNLMIHTWDLVHKQDGFNQVDVTTVSNVWLLSTDQLTQHSGLGETHTRSLQSHSRLPVQTQQTISQEIPLTNDFQVDLPTISMQRRLSLGNPVQQSNTQLSISPISDPKASDHNELAILWEGLYVSVLPREIQKRAFTSHHTLILVVLSWPAQKLIVNAYPNSRQKVVPSTSQERTTSATSLPASSAIARQPSSLRLPHFQKSLVAGGYTRRRAKLILEVHRSSTQSLYHNK